MKTAHFPARRPKTSLQELKPVPLTDKGTEGKLPKFTWMSDGTIKPIEQGLPVLGTPPPALDPKRENPLQTMVKMIVEKPYLKEFYKNYGALAAAHPEIDPNDPDMLSHYEKQLIATYYQDANDVFAKSELKVRVTDPVTKKQKMSTTPPLDAHLKTWGGAISYMEADIFDDFDTPVNTKPVKKKKKRTGVYGEQNLDAVDQSGVIREVYFKSLENEELDLSLSRDKAGEILIFPQGGKYMNDTGNSSKSRNDPTVKKCIKRFFDPDVGMPFIPADAGKYFPISLLKPKLDEFGTASKVRFETQSMVSIKSETKVECNEKSTLLDTSGQDVLFTKNKAPFTRNDISRVRQFDRHWEMLRRKEQEKANQSLIKRQQYVKKAFHSRAVFETYLRLMDEDCKRIRSGILGKSKFKKKSLWERAVEETPVDNSGMEERRKFWWRLCAFVRYNGGLIEVADKKLIKLIRSKLMLLHEIGESLFWDVLKEVDPTCLENVAALKVIEFIRICFSIGQQEFQLYLDEIGVSRLVYNQTIQNNMSVEFQEKMKELAKGPIDVPDPEE